MQTFISFIKCSNNTNRVKDHEGLQWLTDGKSKKKINLKVKLREVDDEGTGMCSVGDMFIPQVPASAPLLYQ